MPESPDIFDTVRAGFRYVAEQARHVRIDDEGLKNFVAALPDRPPENVYDPEHHYAGGPEDSAAYMMTAESVNFGSGYTQDLRGEGWEFVDDSLYFTVSTRLREKFRTEGPLTAEHLAGMSDAECAALFRLDRAKPVSRAVAALFASSMRELGAHVIERYNGRFLNLVEAGRGSAARMIETLLGIAYYRDIHTYKGSTVPILKRVQHTATVLNIGFERLGMPLFADGDRITMFADNAVPHVLRTDGVLRYTWDLAARVEAGTELPPGSEEEIEIRACAGHAVELIAAAKGLKATDIDFILWHRSVEDGRYAKGKTHLTRSRNY